MQLGGRISASQVLDAELRCTMKWEEALKQIQEDRRFNALPTAGERKQAASLGASGNWD